MTFISRRGPGAPRAGTGTASCPKSVAGAAALLTALFVSAAAAEEVSAENKAAARDLATEGIKLAQEGKCDEAIPKLTRAEQLYHAPTILTWIGQCQIDIGHLVEGTETLNRVVREDLDEDAPEAFQAAQAKARELISQARPKIGKLTIKVTPTDLDGLVVEVDERAIASALVGAPKPTDPGPHSVKVSAPGYQSVTRELELAEGGQESLSIELVPDPAGADRGQDAAPLENSGDEPNESESKANWIGWTTVGVGAALMAGGGVMGYLAMSKENDLSCGDDGRCPPSESDSLDAARRNATLSTVLFGVGGAVAVTGVVLLITGKSSAPEEARGSYLEPTVGLGNLGIRGAF